jgi:hypothetical protein
MEPDDLELVSYREYKLPTDLDYPPFKDSSPDHKPYPLWELFPAADPDVTSLGAEPDFLKDKAVVLFLELKKAGLRNCSPNNCDDKGAEVTAATRRLLIKVDDLTKIITEANELGTSVTFADLEVALSARLSLPDLRLPRHDVPNSGLASSNEILAAFHAVFEANKLASKTRNAFTAAYNAFKPILQATYPNNPFANFATNFGFLDEAPKTTAQVRFLQYYWDVFDDLLKAYDEFRWKGAELMCACCPPEGLFPRHLMLGVLFPGSVSNPRLYRHPFLASPAISGCEERTSELIQLFRRLVEMIAQFSNTPKLADVAARSETDLQIRITPSKLGHVPLSDQAIPYYYHQNGTPPLFQLWNPERTRRNRTNQNLSYRSDEYTPTAPAFVTNALSYDLEPYNFLRIEGHLGKNYQSVMNTLLTLKSRYRLPIEVIALRTGAFDENMTVDLSKEDCRFQDLETLYDTLREELLSSLTEGVMYLYGVTKEGPELAGGAPQHPLLKKYAPNFRYAKSTVGAWYEKYLTLFQKRPYLDVDQSKIDVNAVLIVYCSLFTGTADLFEKYYAHAVSIYYLTKLSEVLPASLDALGYLDFENKYQDLMGLIRYFRSDAKNNVSDDLKQFIPQEDLIDQFDQVLFSCKLEPIKAVHEEYVRRIREVKQKQFLSFFLQKHPGIQHKAGVPLGGTFIIVYHQEPEPSKKNVDAINVLRRSLTPANVQAKAKIDTMAIADALHRMSLNPRYADDPEAKFVLGTLVGQVAEQIRKPGSEAEKIIAETVKAMVSETVIADFHLPYICCSDCLPVQFTLPKTPPTFTVQVGCTNSDDIAEVTVTPKGEAGPYTYKVDDAEEFVPLTGELLLKSGLHTLVIQDGAGTESAPRSVPIPGSLTIGKETYTDDTTAKTYLVTFSISGGKAPYSTSDAGTITGNMYTSLPVQSDKPITVEIVDSAGCKTARDFTHTVAPPCDLPCAGVARRCGFRFWLPEPEPNRPYRSYAAKVPVFTFEFPQGGSVDLGGAVNSIIQATPDELNANFDNVVQSWLKRINAQIASKTGSEDWLRLEYAKSRRDPIGILWIEYFECLNFEFNIQSFFNRPEVREQLHMLYTPEGTTIGNLRTKIPAFNCIRTDKCDPERPQVALCGEIDLSLKIIKSIEGAAVILDVEPSGTDSPVAFLWEVQDGKPAASNEKKAKFEFTSADPSIKTIRLTAFTERGCTVTAVDTVNLRARSRRRGPN